MGQPSEAARDFLSGKALPARLANTPPFIALDTRTVQQLAAGRTVCMHEVYKAQAKAAADAQEHRGNSTSSRVLTMLPHHDSTTTPVTWRNMLEVFKAFYPGAAADLDWYAQFMERFLGRASTRAFFIMDHAPAPAVAFATSNSELKVCHLFKKDGKCRFGSDCKYKH